MFTKEELNGIKSLILRSDIKGAESVSVAFLLNKITELLKQEEPAK
jgi:hypothetical protein